MVRTLFSLILLSTLAPAVSQGAEVCANGGLSPYFEKIKTEQVMNSNLLDLRKTHHKQLAEIRDEAQGFALFTTGVFVLCLSLLAASITWIILRSYTKSTVHRMMALALVVIVFHGYVGMSGLIIYHGAQSYREKVKEFNAQLEPLDITLAPLVQDASVYSLTKALDTLEDAQALLPPSYHYNSAHLPKRRWWTFGWDQYYFVAFEQKAVQRLLEITQQKQRILDKVIPEIQELCSQGRWI